jgi:hypothetical protein
MEESIMTDKRFTTNGYYIYDHFKEDKWLVNEVEAEEIVTVMNNLDTKARERSKALSKLQKENEQLKCGNKNLKSVLNDFINICNRLQANPNDKQTVAVARDMIQNMGKELR